MTAPEWVECADPNKLAAAVAAGVRVERSDDDGASWWPTTYRTAENFRHAIAYGTRFRLPRAVSWRLDGERIDVKPDRIARLLWEASHPPENEADWSTIEGVLRQVYEDRAVALLEAARAAVLAEPSTDHPFPIGSRVQSGRLSDNWRKGTVRPSPSGFRHVEWDDTPGVLSIAKVEDLMPPEVPVPADVVARLLATGQVSDDDRAALARAGEGE